MALWLKGAIEEIDCEGEGCRYCPYQIYKNRESFACVGRKGCPYCPLLAIFS